MVRPDAWTDAEIAEASVLISRHIARNPVPGAAARLREAGRLSGLIDSDRARNAVGLFARIRNYPRGSCLQLRLNSSHRRFFMGEPSEISSLPLVIRVEYSQVP